MRQRFNLGANHAPTAGYFAAAIANGSVSLPIPSAVSRAFDKKTNPQTRVALFVGSDITALMIANQVVQGMRDLGFRPALYFPQHVPSSKSQTQHFCVKELAFYERTLLNEVVIPLLEEERLQDGVVYTPNQLAAKYGITVKSVADVNDSSFLHREIIEKNTVGGINIRGYQKFSVPTIDLFNSGTVTGDQPKRSGFLWNTHPGKLGKSDAEREYRGIWTPLRVMLNEEASNWWTLHEIDENYDTGRIIERSPRVIRYEDPMINVYLDYNDVGAGMILGHLEKFKAGELHVQTHARQKRGPLYSFPEQDEIAQFLSKGLRIVNPAKYIDFCLENFTTDTTRDGQSIRIKMQAALEDAIVNFYRKNHTDYRQAYGQQGHAEIENILSSAAQTHAPFGQPRPAA